MESRAFLPAATEQGRSAELKRRRLRYGERGQTLQTQNTTSRVNIEYNSTAVINAHNHTTPSPVGIQSLSSADIKSLGKGYVYCKDHGGDYKASVAYLANNGEAMAYVDSKDKLNKFLATKDNASLNLMLIS